jgi:creatinine amidohydrolase
MDQVRKLALDELSWSEVAGHLANDPRMIMPVGALEQHGPHLPLGTNVLIARRIALDLSIEFDILRAPTFSYGVNVPTDRVFAGTASLSPKVLHRALNELLESWEGHGVTEFVLITAHRHEPHQAALAALTTERARVRVVQVWDVPIHDLLAAQKVPLHGGEAETSVMLHLYPDLVRMERARDFDVSPSDFRRYLRGAMSAPPPGSAGSLGRPTAADAEKGARIYQRILDAIRSGVFIREQAPQTDTL